MPLVSARPYVNQVIAISASSNVLDVYTRTERTRAEPQKVLNINIALIYD